MNRDREASRGKTGMDTSPRELTLPYPLFLDHGMNTASPALTREHRSSLLLAWSPRIILSLLVRQKSQRGRVHAIPQAGGRRSIIEHVAQVCATFCIQYFNTNISIAILQVSRVLAQGDMSLINWLKKGWPASTCSVFRLATEEREARDRTNICARFFVVVAVAIGRLPGHAHFCHCF